MTRPVVAYPDAVSVVQGYLNASLDVPVWTRIPNPRPDTFVRVKRLGGFSSVIVTDRPRVDIHCWAPTEEAAEELSRRTRAYALAMAGKRGDTTVYRVREVSGPQWMPDSESGTPRYAFAIEFSTRGTELEQ